jgi:hypothetical protein
MKFTLSALILIQRFTLSIFKQKRYDIISVKNLTKKATFFDEIRLTQDLRKLREKAIYFTQRGVISVI